MFLKERPGRPLILVEARRRRNGGFRHQEQRDDLIEAAPGYTENRDAGRRRARGASRGRVELAVAGMSNKEIAGRLDVNPSAVENPWVPGSGKKSLAELVRIAMKIAERPDGRMAGATTLAMLMNQHRPSSSLTHRLFWAARRILAGSFRQAAAPSRFKVTGEAPIGCSRRANSAVQMRQSQSQATALDGVR